MDYQSYRDRQQPTIVLTAPDGKLYVAYWRGNTITIPIRLAEFTYPGFDGTTTQALGVSGWQWPLTLYFAEDSQGGQSDNDLNAINFAQSLATKDALGTTTWTVAHPIYGTRYLQPTHATIEANPVESDGLTIVNVDFIEPALQTATQSPAETQSAVNAQTGNLNASNAATAASNVDISTADRLQAIVNSGQQAIGAVQGYINTADQTVATILSGINSAFLAAANIIQIAGQIQQLMMTPNLLIGDVESKIKTLSLMGAAVFANNPANSSNQSATQVTKNTVAMQEVVGAAIVSGMAQTVITSTFTTRIQVVQAINDVTAYMTTLMTAMDAAQAIFSGAPLSLQFWSQAKSYGDMIRLVYLVVQYLLKLLFQLSIVKTYTLTQDTNTFALAVKEYASRGAWSDLYFDAFCQSNGFYGTKLLMLPRGTKVQVFI